MRSTLIPLIPILALGLHGAAGAALVTATFDMSAAGGWCTIGGSNSNCPTGTAAGGSSLTVNGVTLNVGGTRGGVPEILRATAFGMGVNDGLIDNTGSNIDEIFGFSFDQIGTLVSISGIGGLSAGSTTPAGFLMFGGSLGTTVIYDPTGVPSDNGFDLPVEINPPFTGKTWSLNRATDGDRYRLDPFDNTGFALSQIVYQYEDGTGPGTVPEPASALLVLSSLGLLGIASRRRRV